MKCQQSTENDEQILSLEHDRDVLRAVLNRKLTMLSELQGVIFVRETNRLREWAYLCYRNSRFWKLDKREILVWNGPYPRLRHFIEIWSATVFPISTFHNTAEGNSIFSAEGFSVSQIV